MTAYLLDTNHAAQVMAGPDALRELLINRGHPEVERTLFCRLRQSAPSSELAERQSLVGSHSAAGL